MFQGMIALASRIALAGLSCHWAIVGGVILGGGSLPLAAWYTMVCAIPSIVVVAAVIVLAYRKDGLSAWDSSAPARRRSRGCGGVGAQSQHARGSTRNGLGHHDPGQAPRRKSYQGKPVVDGKPTSSGRRQIFHSPTPATVPSLNVSSRAHLRQIVLPRLARHLR